MGELCSNRPVKQVSDGTTAVIPHGVVFYP